MGIPAKTITYLKENFSILFPILSYQNLRQFQVSKLIQNFLKNRKQHFPKEFILLRGKAYIITSWAETSLKLTSVHEVFILCWNLYETRSWSVKITLKYTPNSLLIIKCLCYTEIYTLFWKKETHYCGNCRILIFLADRRMTTWDMWRKNLTVILLAAIARC